MVDNIVILVLYVLAQLRIIDPTSRSPEAGLWCSQDQPQSDIRDTRLRSQDAGHKLGRSRRNSRF